MLKNKLFKVLVTILIFSATLNAQITIVTNIDSATECIGDTIIIPVHVTNFIDVTGFHQSINFDQTSLSYAGYQNINSNLQIGNFLVSNTGASVISSWNTTSSSASIPDGILYEIIFIYNGGSSCLQGAGTYFDIGGPIPSTWIPGCINPILDVDLGHDQIIFPDDTTILVADTFQNCTYLWYPGGQTTNSIIVDMAGIYSVVVYDTILGCKDSSSVHITLILPPCFTQFDLNNWIEEADPSYGDWNVQAGGHSVLQTINGDPTFYCTPDKLMNVVISGKISVIDNGFFFG